MDTTTNAAEASRLTRAQVAKVLGISVAGVRRREGTSLHPQRGPKGEHLFDAAEVEAERRRLAEQGHGSMTEADAHQEAGPPAQPEQPQQSLATGSVASAVEAPRLASPVSAAESTADVLVEATALVFADLNAGRKLCDIVAERGLSPSLVRAAYEEWLQLAQIDTLKIPAGERRLFGLERELEVYTESQDQAFRKIQDMRERVEAIERGLGMEAEVSEYG